jgi:hypothetical protein
MDKVLFTIENIYRKSRREILVLAPRHATNQDAVSFVKMTDPYIRQDEDFRVVENKTRLIAANNVYHWTKQYGVRTMTADYIDIVRQS